MKETWKAIAGFENYHVSNLGRVKNTKTGRILKVKANASGYPTVCLKNNNGPYKIALLHRLIAIAFIPNPLNKPIVNHLNAVRHDYRIKNLEWATMMENTAHMMRLKRHNPSKGEGHTNSKLTEQQVLKIRKLKGVMLQKDIAKKFGVSGTTISGVLNGHLWRHI